MIENVFLVDKLKYNLLRISQLCDKGYTINFKIDKCFITDCSNNIIYTGNRIANVYIIDIVSSFKGSNCLVAKDNNIKWIWHRRLGHANFELILKFFKKNFVIGLQNINFEKDHLYDACQFGKQVKSSFKSKDCISTSIPLQLLHMDLFGPSRTQSLGGKSYAFVIVDDYSRFTWTIFLAFKNKIFIEFSNFTKRIQNKKWHTIVKIRSDNGGEFSNKSFIKFYNDHDLEYNFSTSRTLQQNGVVERKNRSI